MTEPQLIEPLPAQTEKSKAEVEAVIKAVIQKIGDVLESGERVAIRRLEALL